MAKLVVHQEKIEDNQAMINICPFGAMSEEEGKVVIGPACKMCHICVKKGPKGAVKLVEDRHVKQIDKTKWQGVAVYVDHVDGVIHPVTFELLGKARQMANKLHQNVYAIFMGNDIQEKSRELLHFGVDEVYIYDRPELARFQIEPYTSVLEDFIQKVKPCSILVGATTVGRQLAPRIAARMRTGLTADCTKLKMSKSTDLAQIRPAFGGNIMARIKTPNHRPQISTVRYKVMDAPKRAENESGKLIIEQIAAEKLRSNVKVLDIIPKEKEQFIENYDVLVVAGRGIKKKDDLQMLKQLAGLLGGQLACTRPMTENGWMDAKYQIGLSGRTVRPKLIITCGVSGSVQFVAGMNHSDTIFAINQDPKAPIFKTAHYCLVGDLYKVVPQLIKNIKQKRGVQS